jgi:uncharacterized protein (DUF1697 family)
MGKYAAFLLGINVGNRRIKMEDLRKAFESWGVANVKTVQAAGNVLFETAQKDRDALTQKIEAGLKETFGFGVDVIIRTNSEIEELIAAEPFKGIEMTPETRLYVTFLGQRPSDDQRIPYETPEKDYKILRVSDKEVFSVLVLSENRGTTDAMAILGKKFGKKITTRNWNTVIKLAP